jgi:parallel beta-helix repeat protein
MSATIDLKGPSTSPGAPQVTPAAINGAVNTALAQDYATAAAATAAETIRAMAAEAAIAGNTGTNATAITAEATTRAAADAAEATARNTAVLAEQTRAMTAEAANAANIATNATAITTEATTRATAITAEAAARAAADAAEVVARDIAIANAVRLSAELTTVYATLHGIKFDGVTDDTAAWRALLTASPAGTVIECPNGTSIVTSLTIPDGLTLRGCPCYTYFLALNGGSILKCLSTTQTLPVLTMGNSAGLFGIAIWGGGPTVPYAAVYGGSGSMIFMNNCNLYNCGTGIDCGYRQFFVSECNIHENGIGIQQPVDSRFLNNVINASVGSGIYCGTGANDNTFVGNKVEWNGGNNIILFEAANNTIVGNTLDRSGLAGIAMGGCFTTNVNSNIVRRSGRVAAGIIDQDCHFKLQGNTECSVKDNITYIGADDDGTGYLSPAYALGGQQNTSTIVSGNQFAFVTQPFGLYFEPGWQLLNNTGIGDQVATDIGVSALRSGEITLTAAGGLTPTGTFTYVGVGFATFQVGRWYEMTIYCRDATAGFRYAAIINIFLAIEGTATLQISVSNQLGNLFDIAGSGATVTIAGTVAADGSTFTLTFTNTGTSLYQMQYLLQRFGNWII